MTTGQMRIEISRPYGQKWKEKVKRMPDNQVLAIYLRFKKDGVLK